MFLKVSSSEGNFQGDLLLRLMNTLQNGSKVKVEYVFKFMQEILNFLSNWSIIRKMSLEIAGM